MGMWMHPCVLQWPSINPIQEGHARTATLSRPPTRPTCARTPSLLGLALKNNYTFLQPGLALGRG